MKTAFALVLAFAGALAVQQTKTVGKDVLQKQRDVIELLQNVNQLSYNRRIVQAADSLRLEENWQRWEEPQHAKELNKYVEDGLLGQQSVFSVFYPEHLQQAAALARTLISSKDYETFYQVAAWARQNVNPGMFVYALSVAVVHGDQMKDVVLPPIQEVQPNLFVPTEVIARAQKVNQHFTGQDEEVVRDNQGYTIRSNYSGWYLNLHPEQSLSYYLEDVDINANHYYTSIVFPSWMTKEEISVEAERRGEYYIWYNQQLLARYYLERLSNGLGEVPHLDYDHPVETGYVPSLTYANGLPLPVRPNHADLYQRDAQQSYPVSGNYTSSRTSVKDYERRLRDAVDQGYVLTPEGKRVSLDNEDGLNILGLLIDSNEDSPNNRYYGDIEAAARRLLGYALHPLDQDKAVPSALEQYQTALRDPVYYQLIKRILAVTEQQQVNQGPYEQEELEMPGVKIEDVQVDRLITYTDEADIDITNSVVLNEEEMTKGSVQIRARQARLNHKPFNVRINVVSDKATDAFVKVFLGPKYDEYGREIDMDRNRVNFVELDRFNTKLQAGKNVIERNSHESPFFIPDCTTIKQLYQQVLSAVNAGGELKVPDQTRYLGYPQRYMLPKGKVGGQIYQIYVIVNKYHAPQKETELANFFVDYEYSLNYPMDRPIEIEDDFDVPNSYIKDVVIYHKGSEQDINSTNNQ